MISLRKVVCFILISELLSSLTYGCNVTTSRTVSQVSHDSPDKTNNKAQINPPHNAYIGDISEFREAHNCKNKQELLAYAETSIYKVYVCSDMRNEKNNFTLKIAAKDGGLKIGGEAKLGWRESSFVGNNQLYTYSLDIPSIDPESDTYEPYLNIHSFNYRQQNSVKIREKLIKYLSAPQFIQPKSWKTDTLLDKEKLTFVSQILKDKERLKACEIPPRVKTEEDVNQRAQYSSLYKLDDSKYLLQLKCNTYLKYDSFNFLLISVNLSHMQIKMLTLPKIIKDKFGWTSNYDDRLFYGRPLFDQKTKKLKLHIPFSGMPAGGILLVFELRDDELFLVEFKYEGGSNFIPADPVFYTRLYP